MKKRIARYMLVFFLLSAFLGMSACTGKDGKIPGQKEVKEYVNKLVGGEKYELVEKELIETDPDNMEYRFRSKERDLEFQANSTLRRIWFDATETNFYEPDITCNYLQAVWGLYTEDMQKALGTSRRYQNDYQDLMYLLNFEDIKDVTYAIICADEVYSKELSFHDADFLQKNPATTVCIYYSKTEEEALSRKGLVNLCQIDINGQWEYEELYAYIAGKYAQSFKDGRIGDGSDIPTEYLHATHMSKLKNITLNGEPMLYDNGKNPTGSMGLNTDYYLYCWYNYEKQSYMIDMDLGYSPENASYPLINREYVLALGGKYKVDSTSSDWYSTWTIGSDTWEVKAGPDQEPEVTKNGEILELSYLTADEDSNVHATFCRGLTLEDFSKLFNLTYKVDEEQECVRFYTK